MINRTTSSRMLWLAGGLGLALLLPTSAFAIFPPVIPGQITTVTQIPVDKPVVITGDPTPPPVVDPPAHKTPEPAAFVSGLMGLAVGVYFLRRKKVQPCAG